MNGARHNGKGQTRAPRTGAGRPDGDGGRQYAPAAHAPPSSSSSQHGAAHRGTSERRPMPATLEHPAVGQDERTDEQLLEAYRAGDRASFTALVARYQRELFHFLVRFLGDRAAAEDVFQE